MIVVSTTPLSIHTLAEQLLSQQDLATFNRLRPSDWNSGGDDRFDELSSDENAQQWATLHRKINERIKEELCGSQLAFIGWLKNGPHDEASFLSSSDLCDAEFWVPKNEIRLANGEHYVNCLVLDLTSRWFEDVPLSATGGYRLRHAGSFTALGDPILDYGPDRGPRHDAPSGAELGAKQQPATPKNSGRPPAAEMILAFMEATVRLRKPDKPRKAMLMEIAAKYGVKHDTLEGYLKPSAKPTWAVEYNRTEIEEAAARTGKNREELANLIDAFFSTG